MARSDFFVPVGSGAEEQEDFQDKWAELLRSSPACKIIKRELVRTQINVLNDGGEPICVGEPAHHHELFYTVFNTVSKLGKGE